MKSRLDALLRQRELLREHARWLDDEIAGERASIGRLESPIASSPTVAAAPAASTTTPSDGQTIVVPPEADVKGLHNEVRRGCLLYCVLAAAALAGLLAFIYWKYESVPDDPDMPAAPASEQGAPANPR